MALTREQNEQLTRTGPGTLLGDLFRRYWIPAILAEEVAERDGPPVRVQLLGSDPVCLAENAASIAAMILTTDVLITDMPEKDKAPAMPPGGMGGMDY